MADVSASIPPILGDGGILKKAKHHEDNKNPMLAKYAPEEPYTAMNKLEYLDMKIKLEESYILRREIAEAIEDHKRFQETGYSEKNGRGRLMETVMAQGVKLLVSHGVCS